MQIFGSLVILVSKLLYWVCKDNFSGAVTSSLDEDLVLLFAAVVVWWIIAIVIRLPAATAALPASTRMTRAEEVAPIGAGLVQPQATTAKELLREEPPRDEYESSDEEEETGAMRSMFS